MDTVYFQEPSSTDRVVGAARAISSSSLLGGLTFEFDSFLDRASETKPEPIRLANDWEKLAGWGSGDLMGISVRPAGTYSKMERDQLDKLDEEYRALLPQFGNLTFGPPVANYDPRIETLRLAKIEYKVQAMEDAGEFDKAVDAFIGIHGLKDSITAEQRMELRDRIKTITKAVLLEDEWQQAYLGAMTERIDISFDGLRSYLMSESGDVMRRSINSELPDNDPDLLSFRKDPKWSSFEVSPVDLKAKADDMLGKYRASKRSE